MRGVLLLNGEPYGGEIDCDGAYVVCCDGAYDWAAGKVKIDENVGDFDSLGYLPDPPPAKLYPSEKDFTDGEIALFRLIEKGVDGVEIYGGGGGREDHFIGNLHLLYAAHTRGVPAKMITNGAEIIVFSGKISLSCAAGTTFSLLPFGKSVHIMGSEGCKYSYPRVIGYGECRGISNVAQIRGARVEIAQDDCALLIINKGEV